jgi:hypothetical protein
MIGRMPKLLTAKADIEAKSIVEAKTYEQSSRERDPKSSDDIQAQTCIAEP